MYESERERIEAGTTRRASTRPTAAEAFGRWMLGAGTDHLLETSLRDRERIFNLGYYTWVEQQGVGLADFTARRSQAYWVDLRERLASVGRPDRGVQRPHRRDRGPVNAPPSYLRCAGCGWVAAGRRGIPVPVRQRGRRRRRPRLGPRPGHRRSCASLAAASPTRSPATGRCMHSYHLATDAGLSDDEYLQLIAALERSVAAVDGHGFRVTPLRRNALLSDRLGFSRVRRGLGQGRDRRTCPARTRAAT